MNRGLPLAATLLLAPSAALAQPDPPAPDGVDAAPPAAAPARGKPATTLGAPWQIVVGGSVGSLRSVSYDGRDGSEKQAVFGPSVDVFVAPRLSLGAAFLVGADEVPGTEVSRSFFQVGLRLGYVLPLGERMSLWPSVWGGVASGHEQSRLVGDTQTSWSGARFGADVPLLFHVAPHAFVGFGPSLVVDRAGATPDDRSALVGEKRVVVGGVLRVGGYWGGASTPDGVAAPEAPAGPGFAEPGNVVVTDAIGLGASIASYSPDSDARSVSYGLEPSVDVFVGRVSGTPVSLGGGAILARQTTETPGGLSARVTRGTLGAGIRVGVDVPITRGVSFWPMVGLSVLFEHTERIPAQRETVAVAGSTVVTPQGGEAPRYDGVTRFGPTAFAPFLLHPAPHVVLGLGPLWERDVVTYQPNTNVPKRTTLGARGVLGIWFLRSSSPSCCSGDGRSGAWATRGGSATSRP